MALSIGNPPDEADVVVVGSGFGGSVVAARLAAEGVGVCLLEWGRAFPPGSFPAHARRDVRKMVKAKRAVKMEPGDPTYARLPDDYFQYAADIETPMLLVTGDRNRVFTKSNIVCHRMLEKIVPGRHELAILPGYGHQLK